VLNPLARYAESKNLSLARKKKPKTPPLSDAQRSGLRAIRRRRAWFWAWALSYLPVGYAVMHQKRKEVFFAFIAIWTAALACSVIRLRAAICPRCGAPFHSRRTDGNRSRGITLARACLNCGLKLDAGRA